MTMSAFAENVGELVHYGVGERCGDHDPDDARRRELPDEVVERRGTDCALVLELGDRVAIEVSPHEMPGQVGAHPAQTGIMANFIS